MNARINITTIFRESPHGSSHSRGKWSDPLRSVMRCGYILQKVIEEQNGYDFLDSEPQTLTAKEHRPPYGKDGDYFTKPSVEDICEKVYAIMNEFNPTKYPQI